MNLFARGLAALLLGAPLALIAAPNVSAASAAGTSQSNMSVQDYLTYHDRLNRDLETKPFNYVTDASRAKVAAAQAQIHTVLQGKSSIAELSVENRTALVAAHDQVLAVMKDAELDKLECKNQHVMGSHRPKVVCQTKRERLALSDHSREQLRRSQASK
jgi:hypothetical protein